MVMGGGGGGACPPRFTLSTIKSKVVVNAPQLRGQIRYPYFYSIPKCTLCAYL
jgi:hypothetical protein